MKKKLTQNWKQSAINGFLSVVAFGLLLSLVHANNASFARAMDDVLGGLFQSTAEKNTSGQSGADSQAPNTCAVNINRVDVSSCYYYDGQSKATVSVEVAWTDPPGGGVITVTLGALVRTITPGPLIVSPQVVAFEVNADGSSGNVSAAFNLGCLDFEAYTLPTACIPSSCPGGPGVVGGKAFVDYNQDGVQQSGETNGQSGVEVRLFGCDANGASTLVGTQTTDVDGNYFFSGLTDGQTYRVEFTLSTGLITKDYRLGNNGADSRTSVQFVTSPSCTTDIGVFIPSDYCDPNPPVFIPCYTRGNPLAGGDVAGDPALVSFPYNADGPVNMSLITMWANQSQVGSCWGVAYDKKRKRAYSAAFVRRHTGLGPGGIGAIYVTDFTQPPATATSTFVDLNAIGANVGTISNNVARGLLPNRNQPNSDPEGFVKVAKVGIGDIDITDNGDTLYYINLSTRKMQSLRLDNDGNPNTPYTHVNSDISTYDLPSIEYGGGTLRPWGLKVYKGYVYVGAVCDAQASQSKSDLRAFVFRFTPGPNTWTTIFDFPMTYPKGSPFGGTYLNGWYPWTDDWNTFMSANGGSQNVAYPQPILCDIEFDIDGSMVLGFGDRTGFQTGSQDYNTTGAGFYWGFVGGDMLRVYQKNGAFVLENNAKAGPFSGSGVGNNEGPGFGEFYNDIWAGGGHSEIMMGGLAILPGSGQIMAAMMDPLLTGPPYWSNGVRTLNNSDGSYVRAFCVFESADALPDGNFGKASGLGDIELICALPTNTQIGNRIWLDNNKNGIQDPCESTLSNVKVELYDRFGNAVGVTTTDANGEYYFDATNVDTIAPYNSGPKTGMSPNTKYFIVVGKNMTQWNSTNAELFVNGGYYKLGVANTGQAPNSDLNDNDGLVLTGLTGGLTGINGFPGLMITSPQAGDVNHTYDFAFFQDIDYGDLPDNNTTGTYPTDNNNGAGEGVGPCHTIVAGLKIGTTVDFEAGGQPNATATGDDAAGAPDDEDGLTSFPDFVPGTTVSLSIPVMNMRGTTAYLYGFFDWNKNGKLDDPGETIVVNVPNNTNANVTMNVPVPAGAVVGMNLGARFRISTNDELGPTGCAEDGEVEDYLVQAVARDYGDLPDTYGTTSGNNGPSHIVDPNLFLGGCVDAETNGIPQAMAGLMTGGDDNNTGTTTFGTCAPTGDDENGIIFESPLVPGTQACLRVTATNNTGASAILQGWIDFNGNGTFDAGEQLNTGAFAPNGAVIPVGGLAGAQLCFDVPAGATFQGGQAMSRFRISTTGGLTPNGADGIGEVEDHKMPLAKVGTLLWTDYNNDGQQNEPLSSGINGTTVQLVWAGPDAEFNTVNDNRTYTVSTATMGGNPGQYMFFGLISGMYKLSVPTPPAGSIPTTTDAGSDVTDSDNPAGVMVNIPNLTTTFLPTGENGMGDTPGGTNGFPDNQDNLTFDFGYVGFDYGDLPNTYGTTQASNGPRHVVTPNLYLGSCVDNEPDGQPEAMAGLMTGGDDGNTGAGSQGTCTPAGDDENGITFETPMIPGSTACIRVTANNSTGASAKLQAWIDWNGDGDVLDAGEQITSGGFAGGGFTVPNGGVNNAQVCFNVPSNATFQGGQAMIRFRLSPNGGLQSGTAPTDVPPLGEVEDYKVTLAKVGNYVWKDTNNNGQQDEPNTNGINGVTVQLTWLGPNGTVGGGDDVTYTTTTSNMGINGQYMFIGLTPGMYKISIPVLPTGFSNTVLNQGSDVTDADDPAGVMVQIPNPVNLPTGENGTGDTPGGSNGFADNQDDLTYDFGFIGVDYGDLPDTYGTTNPNGPKHLINPNLYLGTCVDGEVNGQPEAMAGAMTGGDDNNSTSAVEGTCATGDDENGIVLFETPLVPGYSACIRVTANNTLGTNAVLQGWIDFNGNGTFETGEQLTTGNFAPSGAVIPNGGVANQQMCFDVPSSATFNGGQVMARFRLSPTGGLAPTGPTAGPFPIGEVEDYKVAVAKIGTYVWNDNNNDGIQNEAGTNGLNNILVQMVWGGPDGDVTTTNDNRVYTTTTSAMGGNNGQYMFWGLIPGAYKVSVPTNPTGFVPTQLNQGGNENLDADNNTGEMVMIPTLPGLPTGENGTGDTPGGFNGFPDAQDNLQIDFGFVALDYGDLPDTYGTTDGSPADGPVHTINPNVKLGTRVDSDPDGQPDPMAGLMSGGDDNNTGGYNEGGAGDDEDGIVFESPMIPGNQACIRVTAMNMLNQSGAVLQMWVDWNGDGDFADAGEAVTTGSFNGPGGGATVPFNTGLNNAQLCFNVPANATFTGGQAFVRFRISPNGNLSPNGPENMPFPIGEVEDYKVPLSKIGNYVWNDNNNDGQQNEPGSNGLNGVTVQLVWFGPNGVAGGGDDVTYSVVTSNMNGVNGQYMFLGLTPGMYKLSVPTFPAGFIPTQLDLGNDVTDSDNPAGTMVSIPNPPTTLPTNENGTGDVPNDPNFPDNQNNLTYDFGFVSVDYGDLPDSYGTTIGSGGPRHIVNPNLKLGASVDGELEGQPEAMAGLMTGGDDNNNGGYNEGGAGDDENGVTFLTPMIPGFQACIRVNTMNNLGGTAVLQGWIDWNGDGDVLDAGEQLNTGSFAAAAPGAIVPAGSNINTDFCFDVPATATFFGGQAFARFRLSPTGGLPAGGPASMPYPIGEVEDYKVPLAKAGNYVWIDANINGIQDESGVLGINNITVELQWAGPDGNFATTIDNRTYTDVTAPENGINGKYLFCGLIPGNYRMVVPPFGYVPTLVIDVNGNTQDFVDSDNPAGVNFTVPNPPTTLPTNENGTGDSPLVINGFPDNQANFSFDFGYLGFDFGDLPNTYGTTQASTGAVHTVNPDLYLGSCVDVDLDGQPEAMAGFMTGGDDGNAGPGSLGTCTPLADDENGISFPTPLIPGNQACVKVTARNNTGGPAILQAWIDFNGNGTFETGEQLTTGSFAPAGATIPNGGVSAQNFCFDVPSNATFNGGNLFARFRYSKNGGVNATGPAIPGNGVFPTGEVEDYKLPLALIGNYTWMDNPDIEGDEDATEMALDGIKLNLIWAGEDGIFQTAANSATPAGDDRVYMTTTSGGGKYIFRGLIPSTNYRLLPQKYTAANGAAGAGIPPVNKILTIPNLPGNDNIDSDGTPAIAISIPNLTSAFLPTGENGLQDNNGANGFPDNQENLSLDLGWIDEPRIAAAMAIKGFEKTECGHFGVIMDLCIKNNSTAPLANLQAMLDLASANAYGSTFLGVLGVPEIVSSTAQQNPAINASYNGAATAPGKNLFDGGSGLLWPGEQICIRVRFNVNPTAPGAPANPKSQAMVSGKAQNFQGVPIPDFFNGGAQYVASDLSDAGMDPMSTNSGVLGDTGGSDDPTPLGTCWQDAQDLVSNDLVYASIDENCVVNLLPGMLLEGENDNCSEEAYPLGGFYKIKSIKTLGGQTVPNPIPASFIGQTLVVEIENILTCNKTWGHVIVEDKLPPVIECADIHVSCAVTNYTPAYLLNTLGIQEAYPYTDDCTPTTLTYTDTWFDLGCNSLGDYSAFVERIWVVKDQYNNQSTCTQYIYFDRKHVFDVHFPSDVTISCGSNQTSPAYTGVPYIPEFGQQFPLWPSSSYCEMTANYNDEILPICDGSYKIIRTWTILDWCLPTSPFPPTTNPQYYVQLIKVLDEQGPDFDCPADLTVGTDPFNCCATPNLPDIIITDNCSRINHIEAKILTHDFETGAQLAAYTMDGSLEDFAGNNYWTSDTLGVFGYTPACLPIGTHSVTYTVTDNCGNHTTCTFNLTVRDLTPPSANCQEFTTVAINVDDPFDCYTPANGCEGAGVTWVPASSFDSGSEDNCGTFKLTIQRMSPYSDCIENLNNEPNCGGDEYEVATSEGDSIKFYCCEVGTTQTVILTVYQLDGNGNIVYQPDGEPVANQCMVQVEVQDKIKPACLPPANTTVSCENFDPSLWAYGKAAVADNCCLDTTKVYQGQCGLQHSANYSLFDTVCNRGTITRTFRAYDCHGFSSQCTQRVFVNYEQDYFVRFPNDVIVTVCDGTGNYGEPTFFGEDCELLGVSFEDEVFTVVPDACFKIERTWTIINWCTYNTNLPCVYVPNPNPNPVTNSTQNLPGPIVSAPGTPAPWAPSNIKVNPSDATATNYSVFYTGGTYNGTTIPGIANNNCFVYKQIIKVIDTQAPTANCPASPVEFCDLTVNNPQLWNEMYWWDGVIGQHDLCEGPTDLNVTATDACSGANINIEYLLFLDLDGDGVMETVVSSTNLPGINNVQYGNASNPNFSGGTPRAFDERGVPTNQKYRFAIDRVKSGNNLTAYVRWDTQAAQANSTNTSVDGVVPELPYGTHKIKWIISDGCGNQSVCEYTFVVKDCKAPTVVCFNGLSVNIMPTGMVTLWATDFLQYAEDNCTPPTPYTPGNQLKYAIRKSGQGTGFPVDAFGQPITNVTFTCDEVGTQPVELWAQDAAGNAAYCETYVIIQDPFNNCGGNPISVAGQLKTEPLSGDQGVEDAQVELAGTPPNGLPSINALGISDNAGQYLFSNYLPLSTDYTVTPVKDDNPMNGVSTFDLVLMSKHILGIEPLNSPYKIIAADVNKSNSVTTFDIVELRKLILGIYTELPNNTSWRFLDKDFAFNDATNPFASVPFAENISLGNALASQMGDDFVGVKIGDLNGSVLANANQQAEDRTAGTLLLDVEDREVKAGEVFDVTFRTAEQVQGFQFTMNLNGLTVADIVKGDKVSADNFGVFADALTTSIDGAGEFTVKFRADKAGKLSEMLQLSSRITRAEAYNQNGESLDVAFRFNNENGQTIAGVGFELYQNQPNPWVGRTMVGFHLPVAATATLTVYDETGRVLFTQKGDFAKGYNAISLDRAMLNTTGLLYYKLETATDSATRKMIQTK